MYHAGDMIVYGNFGVCKIMDVGQIKNGPVDPDQIYYTLQPLNSSGTLFTPVTTNVFMRPTLTREMAETLITKIPGIEEDSCDLRSPNQLKEHYERAFTSHKCEDLIPLIKNFYSKQKEAISVKKKLSKVDEKYMKRAEELLHTELSVALGIPQNEVLDYITNSIQNNQYSVL